MKLENEGILIITTTSSLILYRNRVTSSLFISRDNLVLDFPYNNKFGNRRLQVDRVELILKHYGFTRFITPLTNMNKLHYDDYCFSAVIALQASFGSKRNELAIEVMLAIVSEVFHLPLNGEWSVRLGSQRE